MDQRLRDAIERMNRFVEAEPFKEVWETHSDAAEDMAIVLAALGEGPLAQPQPPGAVPEDYMSDGPWQG